MAAIAFHVPDHVPSHLVWDEDIDAFARQFEDPYVGVGNTVHNGPDIVWARGAYCGRPGWMLTRFKHIQEVHLDPVRFSASFNRDASALLGFDLPLVPFECDPPLHHLYRQLILPRFSPAAINRLEPMVAAICGELIDAFAERGACEFVADFSSLLPSYVFLALMGLPREVLPLFLGWEHDFLRGDSFEVRARAMRAIYDYFSAYLAERRLAPGEDLVSLIATGQTNGRVLTEQEAIGMCITLFIGGLDSVTSGLGWYLRHLAIDQSLQERLRRHPELLPAAVEELSRAYATNSTIRTVRDDTEFQGVKMRRGDMVALPTYLSARDAHEYEDPHRIDIGRVSRNMTFGTGAHHCIGVHLARREIRIVLGQFLSRFRDFHIPPDDEAVWTTQTIWGVKKLPLAWT